jgi:hypothetical protein
MGNKPPAINTKLIQFNAEQYLFFVGTAQAKDFFNILSFKETGD